MGYDPNNFSETDKEGVNLLEQFYSMGVKDLLEQVWFYNYLWGFYDNKFYFV